MLHQSLIGAITLTATLLLTVGNARAFDDARYPDLKGQWVRAPGGAPTGPNPQFDPNKPWGLGQQAPLTPEYQAIFEASLADQAKGGGGSRPGTCVTPGIPSVMQVFQPMEIIVTPDTTHVMMQNAVHRRIFTDGRDWPEEIVPSFLGYSIGKWVDEDSHGRYSVFEVETRGFKGPRAYEASGLPLHRDNRSTHGRHLMGSE
jgi:hypothetical protein